LADVFDRLLSMRLIGWIPNKALRRIVCQDGKIESVSQLGKAASVLPDPKPLQRTNGAMAVDGN
jgi:hypothetical protein